MPDGRVEFDIKFKIDEIDARMAKIENSIKSTANTSTTQVSKMEKGFDSLNKTIMSFVTIGAAVALGRQILAVTTEFQKYFAVLTTSYGSQVKAADAMKMLIDFASKTPFQLTEITGAFVKLKNQGFEPTKDDLTKLGDLASSTGKGLDQLSEGMLDAIMGEWERMKEFGIKAKQNGDLVTISFKGQKTTIDNTAESIRKYITSLGGMEGVSGSMASISETLGGRVSNLGDAWDKLLTQIGNTGGIKEATSALTYLVEGLNDFLDSIGKIGESESLTKFQKFLIYMDKFTFGGDMAEKAIAFDEAIDKTAKAKTDDYIRRLQGTISEYKSLYTDTDKAIATATSYIKDRKFELISLYGEAEMQGFAKGTKEQMVVYQTIKKELIAIDDLLKNPNMIDEMLFGNDDGQKTVGILEELKKQLKGLQDEREKATSEAEIIANDKEIKSVQNLIFYYEHLAQMKRQKAPVKISMNTGEVINIDEKTGKQVSIADRDAEKMNADYLKRQQDAYEELFNNIDRLSRQNLTDRLAELRKQLKAHQNNAKERIRLEEQIFSVEQKLADQTYENVMEIADALRGIMEEVGGEIGKMTAQTIQGIQNIYSSARNVNSAQNTGERVSSSFGLVGAIFTTMLALQDNINKKVKERIDKYYEQEYTIINQINASLERQVELMNNLKGEEALSANINYLNELKNQAAALEKQLQSTGRIISGAHQEGGFLGFNQHTVLDWLDTSKWAIEDFRSYVEQINKQGGPGMDSFAIIQGQNVPGTAENLQYMQDIIDQYDALQKEITEQQNKIAATLTGSTYDSILSGIRDAFSDGELSVEELGNFTTETFRKAILKGFETRFLEKQMQGWYDEFAKASEGGLTDDEVTKLRNSLRSITDTAQEGLNQLANAAGIDFTNADTNNSSALAGAIKAIQEDTANLMVGQMNAQRLIALESKNIALQGYQQLMKIEQNTYTLYEIRDLIKNGNSNNLIADRANGR